MEPEKLLQIWPSPTSPEILIKWKNFLDFEATEEVPLSPFCCQFPQFNLEDKVIVGVGGGYGIDELL